MNPLNEKTGWIVAPWCWLVSWMPNAPTLLVYLSIIVAILQIIVLTKKVFSRGNRKS